MFLTVYTSLRAQMPIECIHSGESLLASLTCVRPDVQVKCLVSLTVMLTSKPFLTTGPLALEGSLLIVRSQMSSKIEMSRKGTTAAGHRAYESGFGPPPVS